MSAKREDTRGLTLPVYFENDQWAVTSYGIESLDRRMRYYPIDKKRLLETTQRHELFYDWPVHMAEKSWVNIDHFIEAFTQALDHHVGRANIDPAMLVRSVNWARTSAERYRRP